MPCVIMQDLIAISFATDAMSVRWVKFDDVRRISRPASREDRPARLSAARSRWATIDRRRPAGVGDGSGAAALRPRAWPRARQVAGILQYAYRPAWPVHSPHVAARSSSAPMDQIFDRRVHPMGRDHGRTESQPAPDTKRARSHRAAAAAPSGIGDQAWICGPFSRVVVML